MVGRGCKVWAGGLAATASGEDGDMHADAVLLSGHARDSVEMKRLGVASVLSSIEWLGLDRW